MPTVSLEKKLQNIKQPELVTDLQKRDSVKILGVDISLYKKVNDKIYYISVEDYCVKLLGIKYDSSMFYLTYPSVMYASHPDNNSVKMFISLDGCNAYINFPINKKYIETKRQIYKDFGEVLCAIIIENVLNPDKDLFDFNYSDEDENIPPENNNIEGSTEIIEKEFTEKDNAENVIIDVLFEPVKKYALKLEDENKNLKEQINKMQTVNHHSTNIDKTNALIKFINACESSIHPFENPYILDTITTIIDKARQEHIANGGHQYDFLVDFNKATNKTTIYKDLPREYDNEPFARVALRTYGFEVLDFALKSNYRQYTLHQFKNMFDINITNNPFVLLMITSLLNRKIGFDYVNGHVSPYINFNIPYLTMGVNNNENN